MLSAHCPEKKLSVKARKSQGWDSSCTACAQPLCSVSSQDTPHPCTWALYPYIWSLIPLDLNSTSAAFSSPGFSPIQ